jgi:hypothetical protein
VDENDLPGRRTSENHRKNDLVAMVPGTPEEYRDQLIALDLFAQS